MMTDDTRNELEDDNGTSGAVSFSQPNFDEAAAIASLKSALPKTEQVGRGSVLAEESLDSTNKDAEVANASERNTARLAELSPIEQDLMNRLDTSLGRAEEVNRDIRTRDGSALLDSLQNGLIRVGSMVINAPSTQELKTRLESLSPRELSAINEVRTYEMAQTELDKKIGEMVERTDLDPFTRELMRGELQKAKDTMRVPTEALAIMDAPRTLELGSAQGGPATQQLLEQGPRSFGGSSLRNYVEQIESEYADIERTEKYLEQFKADVDPIFKEDLQRENLENTEEGLKQLETGSKAFSEGDYVSGTADVLGGALRTLGGSIEAAWDNPEAIMEVVAETVPQMALAFNPYTRAITNSAYVGDVYKEALVEYKKENDGQLPDQDELGRMALASIGAGILEVAADKVLVGGTNKLKDGLDPAVLAAIKGASDNKYLRNAITRIGGRAGVSTVTEAVTEAGQTALEEVAKGNEVDGSEVSLAGVIGGITGGGTAGAVQGVRETVQGARVAGSVISDKASEVADNFQTSPEEQIVKDVRKVLRKQPAKRTSAEKKQVVQAKVSIETERARLELLRKTPGVSDAVIAAQEKKVNSMQTRGAALQEEKPDTSVFDSIPEDQSLDDYLGEVSYQIGLDSDGELSAENIQKAVDNAVAKGATDEQVESLVKLVQAKKTSSEVSDNIIIGDADWRGGGTYIANILTAQEAGNEELAAYNASEIMRFSDYINTKVEAFREAQAEAKRLGRSVKVINPVETSELGEDIPYVSLDGNDMYATGDMRTDELIATMTNDNEVLGELTVTALDIWTNKKTPQEILAEMTAQTGQTTQDEVVEEPVTETVDETVDEEVPVEEPVQEPVQEDVQPEEPVEPQFKANTEKVQQDLDDVLNGTNFNVDSVSEAVPDSTSESSTSAENRINVEARPESGDVIARAFNSTQSPGVKRAIRELGKQIRYKERDGVVVEQLDSSIAENHYREALNLIKQSIEDPTFGKTLQTKSIGEVQHDDLIDGYFVPQEALERPAAPTQAFSSQAEAEAYNAAVSAYNKSLEVRYLGSNEFKAETKVSGFVSETGLNSETVFARGMEIGLNQQKAQQVTDVFNHGRRTFAPLLNAQFQKQVRPVYADTPQNRKLNRVGQPKVIAPEYMKTSTEFASNFQDSSGGLVTFMYKGMVIGVTDYLINNSQLEPSPTPSQVRAIAGIDSKADIPAKLMAYMTEIGIGETKGRIIETLGNNALRVAGVKFNGAHSNTQARHISAAGNIMFNALKDAGILVGKKISINQMVWRGAELDNAPQIAALKARAAKQNIKVAEPEVWPGNQFVGDYIIFGDVIRKWNGRGYTTDDDVSQGGYLETFYVNPEADIGGFSVDNYLEFVKGTSTPFAKVFNTDRLSRIPAMQTPRKNTGKIKGFDHKKLNKAQKAAQDKQSEKPLYLDKGIMRVKEAFGDDRILRMAGYTKFDPETTNKVLRLSLEGKNQTVKTDLENLNTFIVDMSTEAEFYGVEDFTDIPFFANFFNSGYQRQFVDSQTFNYQSSKAMHRFMAHHEPQTMDLNNPEQTAAFLLSVAQGLGVSVDKLSSATSLSELSQILDDAAEPIGIMQRFESGETLTPDEMNLVTEFVAGEENMHSLLALREYARYLNALDTKYQTTLEVVMPIELDGVNNGPITAILQSITADMNGTAYLRRAGITKAKDDLRTNGERYEDKKDGLYEEGAQAFQRELEDMNSVLQSEGDTAALSILNSQIGLKALNPKFVNTSSRLEVMRNETKSLITKMFYNAQAPSLLRAETDELMDNFYNELQRIIDGRESMPLEMLASIMARAATPVSQGKWKPALTPVQWENKVGETYANIMSRLDTPEKMVEFSLGSDIEGQLMDNMREKFSYGYIKVTTIQNTYESAVVQARITTKMMNVAGVIGRTYLRQKMNELRTQHGLSKYEALPTKVLEELYSEVGEYLPNLKLNMHTAEDTSDAIPMYKYGRIPNNHKIRNADGTFTIEPNYEGINQYGLRANDGTAPVYVTGRELVTIGAGAVAASTISVADASSIFGIMQQLDEGFMTVFDGVLINGIRMDVLAQAANASYINSLRNNNTFSLLNANYQKIIHLYETMSTDDQMRMELADALRMKEAGDASWADIDSRIETLTSTAEDIEFGIEKGAVLGDEDLAVDQFGSVNDKVTVISPDGTVKDAFAELDPLNPIENYYENVDIEAPLDTQIIRKTVNNPSLAGFVSRNWNNSIPFNKRGSKQRLYNLVKQHGDDTSEFAEFLRKGLIDNILMPAFESIGSMPRIVVVDNDGMINEVGKDAKGAFRYADNTIFLNTDKGGANLETLFHEFTHAALDIALTNRGVKNKKFAAEIEALAVEAKEFIEQNQELVTRFSKDTYGVDGVNKFVPWSNKDGSINTREFLAWSLTNYAVITQLAQAKSEVNPESLFGRIWNFIRQVVRRLTINKDRVMEDSIFSFVFSTAADLARDAQKPKEGKRGYSLQEDYANINRAAAEQTFDDLAQMSNISSSQSVLLNDVFTREILPLFNSAKYRFLNSMENTAERLNELKDAGADMRLDNFKGAFNMSPVEEHTFQMYRAIMVEALIDNDKYAKELAELYKNAKLVIKPEDFGPNGQAMYDSVFVNHGSPKAKLETTSAGISHVYNRSEYLASFAALARVNMTMREALDKAYVRRPDKADKAADMDVRIIETMVDLFKKVAVDRYTGTAGLNTYRQRVDRLSKRMAVADQVGKSRLERRAAEAAIKLDAGYGVYKRAFDKGLKMVFDNIIARQLKRTAGTIASGVSQAFNNRDREGIDALHQSLFHGVMSWLPRMVEEMSPTGEGNRGVRRLSIGKTRAIGAARDGKIKAVKATLREIFKRDLKEFEHKALTDVLLDSDLRAIMESQVLQQQDVLALLRDETKLDEAIETLKDLIYAESKAYGSFHVRSAFSLGTHIGMGKPSEEFTFHNAKLIAQQVVDNHAQEYDPVSVEPLIDQLATLVALKHKSQNSRSVAATILENTHVYGHLNSILSVFKQDMIDHRYQGNELMVPKGGYKENYDTAKDLKMVRESELNKHTSSNYSLHREVNKDASDGNPDRLFIVSSSTGGLGEYLQGLYSTINAAQAGIQNLDGRVTFHGYDDYVTMQKFSKLTRARKAKALSAMFNNVAPSMEGKDYLMPVVNEYGNTTGFQYVLSRAERENLLGRDNNFIDALAQSYGRTVEAEGTIDFNKEINQQLLDAWNVARVRGNTDRFIEISKDAPTKRGREAYRMMPPEARAHLHRIWGDVAYVHSSLFDTVYGYRKASIANVLRKHMPDDERSTWVKQLGRALTANYKLEKPLVNAVLHGERFLTEVSHTIKDLIVIRGLRVMLGNMVSNTVQLVLQEDMPLRKAIKYQIEGITEARRYQNAQSKIRRLEFERDIEPNLRKTALIDSRIVELQEELARNPARHLIDHGLLTAIVEDVESDDNPFSYMNRLNNKITGMTSHLPNGARSTVNALLVNKDSEVYRSLYMFTQLGDFSSRYAALKYRTESKGEVTANDIDEVVDAFINYDLPSNKYLQYLGDVGQLWFFKYFFRIQNVIIRNTLRNPRRVLELVAMLNITGLNISTYFDAFFLFNSITNKMGFFQYAEMGWESLPVVQVYDMF